jgi:hypothetical protein
MKDLTGDGDARDAGEAMVGLDFATSAFPTAKPISVFFLPEEPGLFGAGGLTSAGVPLTLRWENETGLPIPGNAGFAVDLTQAPSNAVVGLLYSDTLTAIPLDSLAPAVADPSVYLYTDLFSPDSGAIDPGLLTDGSGNARIPVPLPPSLSVLAGKSFCLQGLTVDWSLTLPVVLSNAVTFSIL